MKSTITNKISTPVFVILALILFGATISTAAPGDLDPTFGIGGKLTDWTGGANAVVIQADGKIVAVGLTYYRFAVARYNTDGSPDATFGNAGRVSFPVGWFGYSYGIDAAIQPDGKIIASCYDDDQGIGAFVRLNANGSLDTSFGSNGTIDTGGDAYSVAIQPDGKIITSGGLPFSDPPQRIGRFNTNGSIDTTFGNGGVTDLPIFASAVVLQPDGKIVAAGQAGQASGAFAVARLNADGTADQSFGSAGLATAPIGSDARANSVSVQSDGKIVAVGRRYTGSGYADYSLVRYNANGSLDTTFDSDGIVALAEELCCWAHYGFRHVVALNDGKILVSGTDFNGSNSDFAVGRYNSNGSLDTTFGGGDGIATVDFNSPYDFANSMALDAQGRAVVVGGSTGGFALARFLLQPDTPFDYDGDGRSDISVFRPSDRVWYLNQSTAGFSATQFGLSTDKITPADYDGDGRTDISVYRDGVWYRLNSSNQSVEIAQFGLPDDVPVPADYTGDGRSELAIYRNGTWWIQDLTNNQTQVVNFGLATDKPVAADYDGDGRADQAVYRDGVWHLNQSSLGYAVVNFGLATDKLVPADYDGDGKADQAVYRDGTWYVLQSLNGFTAFPFGIASDIPAPADYDGDGKTDAAVFRDGVWYLRQSTSGVSIQQFGLPNDKPVPAAYLP